MFVRLFVDENLDRHVPISKQPKEKIQVNASTSPSNSTTMTSLRRKVSLNDIRTGYHRQLHSAIPGIFREGAKKNPNLPQILQKVL